MSAAPILVVGRSGQLSRSLVEAAAQRGIRLVAIGRPDLDVTDVRSVEQAARAVRPSAIVNAAGYTAVNQAESEPAQTFAINRDGAEHVAIEAEKLGVPLIQISTDYVFDGEKLSPYNEEDAALPLGIYGRSKLEGEEVVRETCRTAVVLRTSWIYSPYGHNFVKTMLRLAQADNHVRVVDDQRGSPTSAYDLANAILDILGQLGQNSFSSRAGLYHLAAQGDTTWHGFASAIYTEWAERGRPITKLIPITSAELTSLARRPVNSRLDCGKIERQFGVRLPSWQLSLNACLDRLLPDAELQRC